MLDSIEPESVALGGVKGPHHRANQISVHIFGDRRAIDAVEGMPGTAERGGGGIHIVLGIVRVANERDFRNGAAESVSEITVNRTRLVGEINQTAEGLILDIPLVAKVLDIRPVPVIAAGNGLQMKILRKQAGIKICGSA